MIIVTIENDSATRGSLGSLLTEWPVIGSGAMSFKTKIEKRAIRGLRPQNAPMDGCINGTSLQCLGTDFFGLGG